MAARYAVYYAPEPGSALAAFGRRWLGRDAASGEPVPQEAPPGLSAQELAEITRAPRHYGFHGTLKPPFRLAAGQTDEALREAVAGFAAARAPFDMPPLRLAMLGHFLALVPSRPCPALDALAADCVRAFDAFRAPPDPAELERRRGGGLSDRQERLLRLWGYPYVLEEFRFHLTLTGPVAEARARDAVRAALEPLVAPLCREPVPVRSICLFAQAEAAAPFRILARHALGG